MFGLNFKGVTYIVSIKRVRAAECAGLFGSSLEMNSVDIISKEITSKIQQETPILFHLVVIQP